MKKTLIFKYILFFLMFQFFYAFSAFAVDRSITEQDTCSPLVSFQVVPGGSVTSWFATENLPSGLTPANIKGMGTWDSYNRTITWGPFNDTVTRNLSYEITGGADSYILTGTLTFDGATEAIAGDSQADIVCAAQLEQVALPVLSPASGATAPQSVTISSATSDAEIRYTTDGSVPDSESDLFAAGTPIQIVAKTHLRVRAFKHDMLDSDVVSALYPAPAPTAPGSLVRTVTNNNTCTPDIEIAVTPAAEVKTYAVQENVPVGLTPDNISHSGIFDANLDLIKWGPFNDNTARTLTYDYGTAGSDLDYTAIGTGSFDGTAVNISGDTGFTIDCMVIPDQVAVPVFDPVSGSAVPVTMTLTCATADAEIRYTSDGSLPDSGSALYDANSKPDFTASVNVRARAFKAGMLVSDTVNAGYVEPVYFSARSRVVTNNGACGPLVTLTVNPSAGVESYCVEEFLPEALTPLNIDENGVFDSVNHKVKWGPFNDNVNRTFSYNVQGVSGTYPVSGKISANGKSVAIDNDNEIIITCTQVEAPIVSPYGNEPVPVTVSLTCPTAGASIYYTIDGSTPDSNSTLYSVPLDFADETTLKARSYKAGMVPSEIITARYPKAFSYADLVRSVTDIDDCSSSVSITMTQVEPFASWALEETLPSGTMPQNINENGFWDNVAHKIKWGPFNNSNQRTLTYELIGAKGGHPLVGYASYDGTSEKISGDAAATIDCGTALPKVAAPVFDQASGTPVPLTIAVSSSTAAAEIRYTIDGSLPDSGSTLYTAPLNLTSRTSLRAMAFKTGMQESDVTSAFYPEPAAPALGTARRSVSANDSCNPSASISVTPENRVKSYGVEEKIITGVMVHHINENGIFDQDRNVIKWGPFNDNTARTLTYDITGPNVAFSPDGIASFNGTSIGLTGDSNFSIVCLPASSQAAPPVFSPVSGTGVPVAVTLTCSTPGAQIYYTRDGSIPDELSLLYSGPIQLNEASTLRAKAFVAGMIGSEPVSASYRAASLCAEEIKREILLDNTCYPLIRMRVVPVQGSSSWAVEENIPVGVTPSRINNSGVWDASLRKIKWGPFLNGITRTLMYNLYGSDGTYSITGYVSINGKPENIAGLHQIHVLCVAADFDEDGIPDAVDTGSGGGSCPSAYDSDSDDDGLLDGLEDANQNGVVDPGETDPCNLDTDGDGVQDGTELGLTVDDLWGDTDLSVFQPDSDPSTTTDPTNPDSDGDGYYDGEEMRLGSDPNNSADTCVYTPGTYVLDNSVGNDLSGQGTSGSPWRTLHHAVHHLNGGTAGNYFIQLGTGTYSVAQGEDAQPIVISQDNVTMAGSGIGNTVLSGSGGGLWENGLGISGNNILVREMSIQGFETSGIEVTGSGTVINHCEISGNATGILITGTGNNTLVSGNCDIFQNTDFGILIEGGDDNIITNNTASIYDNGIGISITSGSANNLVENNNIYWSGDPVNIQTIGILVSDAGTGNELIGNNIHDHSGTGYIGIKVENTVLDIFQNRMFDNETGIHLYSISAPASPRVWNNLLYDSAGGMRDGIYLENQPGGTVVPQIFHNTLAGGSNDGISNNGTGADPLLSYNIIAGFGQNGINNAGGLPVIDYNDVYSNSASDYNGCGAGVNDISVDPDFVGGSNYHLNLTSGCIDSIPAASGDLLTEDLDGNLRPAGSGYDIGCYESPAGWYRDADGDGFGDPNDSITAATQPTGYVADNTDCNDNDDAINPGVIEICGDGIDNNCNGETDEGCCVETTFYRDIDGDGYGDAAFSQQACTVPAGYVANSGDCNDNDDAINPGVIEICGDGIDNNCNGEVDEGCCVETTFYRDVDGDGYGDAAASLQACSAPAGYVADNSDCNDCDPDEHPGQIWYRDIDGDGYSSGVAMVDVCLRPNDYYVAGELKATSGDSVDDDNSVYPGAPELYDGIDNNLNGIIDEECSSAGAVKLPDTGQSLYFDNVGPIATPAHDEPFFGQDAQFYHNRSYTKLGINGQELPDDADQWLMVRDNVSGLIWEVKHNRDTESNFADPNDADNRYTWYDSNPETNGGKPGHPRQGTDTEDFIATLNSMSYGGFRNWRLPTVSELSGLINRGRNSPAVNLEFFLWTEPLPYWSATPYAYTDEDKAWHVYFGYGYVGSGLTSALCYVRAVR